jgi:ornithine cyclodeaminase/alanine dehydrogenase-like protein (mu-crystallin family)
VGPRAGHPEHERIEADRKERAGHDAEDARAELGDVVAGRASGRESPEEITIFDSTGIALQDLVAAVAVYERAQGQSEGPGAARFNFGG